MFLFFVLGFSPHKTTLIKLISPVLLFALALIHSTLPMSVPFFSHAIFHSAVKFEAPGSAETIATHLGRLPDYNVFGSK